MDQVKIELITSLNPSLAADDYADSVVRVLTPPGLLHPIKRYKFFKSYPTRVRVVMAEYAKELISAIPTKTTKTKPPRPSQTEDQAKATDNPSRRSDEQKAEA